MKVLIQRNRMFSNRLLCPDESAISNVRVKCQKTCLIRLIVDIKFKLKPAFFSIAAFLCLFVGMAGQASANTEAMSISKTSTINEARLAAKLVAYGDRQNDPEILLIAARIIQRHGLQSASKPTTLDGKQALSLSASAVLDRARALVEKSSQNRQDVKSASQAALLGQIADARNSVTRGAQRGAWTDRLIAPAQKDSRQTLVFKKGEPARYGVDGDGDTELELEVLDLSGKKICGINTPGDQKECVWTPSVTAEYLIIVRNKGPLANAFTFWHN
jgi:hypothetical protein